MINSLRYYKKVIFKSHKYLVHDKKMNVTKINIVE